jgi:hypothetical protein
VFLAKSLVFSVVFSLVLFLSVAIRRKHPPKTPTSDSAQRTRLRTRQAATKCNAGGEDISSDQ